MLDLNEIRNHVDKALHEGSFRAKGRRTWTRAFNEITQMVHLDKSSYGPQNRLDAYLTSQKDLETSSMRLKNFDTVIRFGRICTIANDLKLALDQEVSTMPIEVRSHIIHESVSELLSILDIASNLSGIIKLQSRFSNPNDFFVGMQMKELLKAVIV